MSNELFKAHLDSALAAEYGIRLRGRHEALKALRRKLSYLRSKEEKYQSLMFVLRENTLEILRKDKPRKELTEALW